MQLILSNSWNLLTSHLARFVPFFILQCFIQLISPLAETYGILPGSQPAVWVELLSAALTIWNFSYLLHLIMSIKANKPEDFMELIIRATYDCPAFFLYSLLYGLSFLFGLFFLVIPGIYFFIFNYFAPIASILDPEANEGGESYFTYSRRLVKPHWGKIVIFLFILLILNAFIPSLNFVPEFKDIRLSLDFALTPVEVVMVLFGDILAVETYYFLKNHNDLGDEEVL